MDFRELQGLYGHALNVGMFRSTSFGNVDMRTF